MKTFFLLFLSASLFLVACQSSSSEQDEGADNTPMQVAEPEPEVPVDPVQQEMNRIAANLKNALRNDLLKDDLNGIDDEQRRFAFEKFDLNEDGKDEYLVGFIKNRYFCGTGGCTYMLLDHEGNLVTRFSVADGPFIVLEEKHNGWYDLAVESGGKLRHLVFDGAKYPTNPSLAPAIKEDDRPGDGLPRLIDPTLPLPMYDF